MCVHDSSARSPLHRRTPTPFGDTMRSAGFAWRHYRTKRARSTTACRSSVWVREARLSGGTASGRDGGVGRRRCAGGAVAMAAAAAMVGAAGLRQEGVAPGGGIDSPIEVRDVERLSEARRMAGSSCSIPATSICMIRGSLTSARPCRRWPRSGNPQGCRPPLSVPGPSRPRACPPCPTRGRPGTRTSGLGVADRADQCIACLRVAKLAEGPADHCAARDRFLIPLELLDQDLDGLDFLARSCRNTGAKPAWNMQDNARSGRDCRWTVFKNDRAVDPMY